MSVMTKSVGVVYCEGWDARSRAVIGPLTSEVARERDRAGEQYAVLLLAGRTPSALLEISWRHHVCTVWSFDAQQRRAAKYDLRTLADDRLLLIEQVEWRYLDTWVPELGHATARRTRRYSLDGLYSETYQPAGDLGGSSHNVGLTSTGLQRHPTPTFGDWTTLADLAGEMSPGTTFIEYGSPPPGLAVSPLLGPPWRPPVPLQPASLEPMFCDGARYAIPDYGTVIVEVREVGQLRMPTGRLVAADPGVLYDGVPPRLVADSVPFTAQVSPGAYPVALSLVRWVDHPEHVTVAAGRLLISSEPVASWEMALRLGDDPRTLGNGEFYGFGVDTGAACFVDAAAVGGVARMAEPHRDMLKQVQGGRTVEATDSASGANLIAFSSGLGNGEYPVWVGRTASGEVACFVADMLLLDDSRSLPQRNIGRRAVPFGDGPAITAMDISLKGE